MQWNQNQIKLSNQIIKSNQSGPFKSNQVKLHTIQTLIFWGRNHGSPIIKGMAKIK